MRGFVGVMFTLLCLAAAMFGWFVWPTPWVHLGSFTGGGRTVGVPYTYKYEIRRHVFTGEFQRRFAGYDWEPTD